MPRVLLNAQRRIQDHAPGSVNPARWTPIMTANPSWIAETVASYPGSFHIGHYLSADGLTATAPHDDHDESKVADRRHQVENWAAAVGGNLAVLREAAIGNAMAATYLDYRTMMLSAALTDENLSTDSIWSVIEAGLVSLDKFLSWHQSSWTATAIRSAMRNGTTFYTTREFADSVDHAIMHVGTQASTTVRMTALTQRRRAGL